MNQLKKVVIQQSSQNGFQQLPTLLSAGSGMLVNSRQRPAGTVHHKLGIATSRYRWLL